MQENQPILTIGHSTRSLAELVDLLCPNSVTMVADIRTVPKSRTNPQFNKEILAKTLPNAGIKYTHIAALGGLRRAKANSLNKIWQNESFRGYADYMETPAFQQGIEQLLQLAQQDKVAIMCAEAVWWRCHRSMVADELVAEGVHVEHIIGDSAPKPHKLRSFAHVEKGHVSYR